MLFFWRLEAFNAFLMAIVGLFGVKNFVIRQQWTLMHLLFGKYFGFNKWNSTYFLNREWQTDLLQKLDSFTYNIFNLLTFNLNLFYLPFETSVLFSNQMKETKHCKSVCTIVHEYWVMLIFGFSMKSLYCLRKIKRSKFFFSWNIVICKFC